MNPGENIESDFFSYLKAPWQDVPAFTAVLKRKTNMAEIVYFFDTVRVGEDGLKYLLPPQPQGPNTSTLLRGPVAATAASSIVKKLLAKAGAKVGGAVVENVGAIVPSSR